MDHIACRAPAALHRLKLRLDLVEFELRGLEHLRLVWAELVLEDFPGGDGAGEAYPMPAKLRRLHGLHMLGVVRRVIRDEPPRSRLRP